MASILVVEDNAMNREVLIRRLKSRGFKTISASDGLEAIKLLETENPDLILMDLRMPNMDGWTATKEIKNNDKTSHIPIIALSANTHEDDVSRALDAGCSYFEAKPLNFKRLIETINKILTQVAS